MEFLSSILADTNFDFDAFVKIAGSFILISLVLGLIGRGVFGTRSNLNHAVSSAVGILFIYIATIVVITFGGELEQLMPYLAPLPFVEIQEDTLAVFQFMSAPHPEICAQVLSMIILAFLVNLLDDLLPRGTNVLGWFLFRCVTVALAMAAHFIVTTMFSVYLPEVVSANAPMILLWVLIIMLGVGALKFVVGAALATVNPIIGILYTFFFANVVGKQLSKAVLTTALLTALVWAVGQIGITVVSINSAALGAYMPFLLVLAIIWYVLNHVL